MKSIILVDGDTEVHRSVLPRLRERFPEAAIHASADGAAGFSLIERFKPELVILDLALPSIDGLALLLRLRARWPDSGVVVTGTNHFVLRHLQRDFTLGGMAKILPKPFAPDQLIKLAVESLCGAPVSVLRGVNVISVLQLFAMEGKTYWVDVVTAEGMRGLLRIMHGEVVYASFGSHLGSKALQSMMLLDGAVYEVYTSEDRNPLMRNIYSPLNELLLMCCSINDENTQVA